MARRWAALLGLLALPALAGGYPLEIVELRARLPEDLIPILAPLVEPDGTLVGSGHTLFVRAAPDRLAELRRALDTLDQPARSLLIQVRQRGSTQDRGLGAHIDADGARVRIGPPGPGGARAEVWADRSAETRDLSQEVRALDGHPAFIAIGRDQPVPYREIATDPWNRGAATVREGTVYRRSDSGFSVVPRVQGDRVTLELSAGTALPQRRGGVATSAAAATVHGRLGEWIALGASLATVGAESAGLAGRGQGQRREESRIELRVLPLD